MNEDQIRAIAADVYFQLGTQYGVSSTPAHSHNNIDTNQIPSMSNIPNSGNGVLGKSQLTGTVNGASSVTQTVYSASSSTPSVTNLLTVPIPVIGGFGTTDATWAMTAGAAAGATSATLTTNWTGATSIQATQFDNGEIRKVQFTNGAKTMTWVTPLVFSTVTAGLLVLANARFHGGEAPLGTAVIFVNTDDGLYQLWVRADLTGGTPNLIDKWIGFTNSVLSANSQP